MRLYLVMILCFGCMTSVFADMGDITVRSYIDQKFVAEIPLLNMAADTNYDDIKISVAPLEVFKRYGIEPNADFAALRFQLVHKDSPIIKISSIRAINTPVLNLIIRYQVAKDDFYRQYTVFLYPLTYNTTHNNKPEVSTQISLDKIITTEQDNHNKDQIPIYPTESLRIAPAIDRFTLDMRSSFVQQHIGKFNKANMSYAAGDSDSTYIVAKFLQNIYPYANFSVTQVILAIAIYNYPNAYNLMDLYTANNMVLELPKPQFIDKVSPDLADAYLLNLTLTDQERKAILKAIANNLKINLADNVADIFKKPLHAVANITQPLMQHKTSMFAAWQADVQLLWQNYRIYIVLLISLLAVSSILYNSKLTWFKLYTKHFIKHAVRGATTITAANPAVIIKNDNSSYTKANAATNVVSIDNDKDVILMLEHILAADPLRTDVRYKLFELYAANGDIAKIQHTFQELTLRMPTDSNLINKLYDIAKKYDVSLHNIQDDSKSISAEDKNNNVEISHKHDIIL